MEFASLGNGEGEEDLLTIVQSNDQLHLSQLQLSLNFTSAEVAWFICAQQSLPFDCRCVRRYSAPFLGGMSSYKPQQLLLRNQITEKRSLCNDLGENSCNEFELVMWQYFHLIFQQSLFYNQLQITKVLLSEQTFACTFYIGYPLPKPDILPAHERLF